MKYILLLVIALNLNAYQVNYSDKKQFELKARYTKELNNFSYEQYKILLKTYAKAQPFDLSLTMIAIAWEESQFGKNMVNYADPSFGVFHNLLGSVMRRHDYKNTNWKKSRVIEALLFDYDFSFSESLNELEMWKSYWKRKNVEDQWVHMVRSYNTGVKWTDEEHYVDKIILKVRILKLYIKKHKKLFDAIKYKGE